MTLKPTIPVLTNTDIDLIVAAVTDALRAPTRPMPRAIADVIEERARQEGLVLSGEFTNTCASPDMEEGYKLAVLIEEVGEVATAVLGREGLAVDAPGDLRTELVQVAAVAVAWIEALDAEGAS